MTDQPRSSWRDQLAAYRSGTTDREPVEADEAVAEEATSADPAPDAEPEGTDELEEPADEEPADEERRRPRGLVLATVLAVLFALVAVFLAVVAADLKAELDDERDERGAIERVSGRFGEALLTYQFDDLEAAKERVLRLSTGTFRTEYEAAFPGLSELISQGQASAEATVKDVFVSRVDDTRAAAIVVVDAVGEGASGPTRQLDTYMRLDLVRTDRGWLVDGVTALNFARPAGPVGGGGGDDADPEG